MSSGEQLGGSRPEGRLPLRGPAYPADESLWDIVFHVSSRSTPEESLFEVCRTAAMIVPADSCCVFLYDAESSSLWRGASYARVPEAELVTEDIRLKISRESFFFRCLEAGEPVILRKGKGDPLVDTSAFRVVLLHPVVGRQGPLGVVAFGWVPGGSRLRKGSSLTARAVVSVATALVVQMRLSSELERSEQRYRALMEGARDLVFVLDGGGRFLYVNPRSREMLGFEPEEMQGRYFGEFVTGESWAETISALRNAISSGERFLDYRWTICCKDGKLLTLDVRASVVVSRGEVVRHQGIARDVSEVQALHEELERRDRELNATRSNEERMKDYLRVATLAQEEERARIARELHDGPVQELVALRRQVDILKKVSSKREREAALREMDDLVDRAIRELREFSRNLRPPILDDFGLAHAVESLVEQVARGGLQASFSVEGCPRRLDREVEVACFRIAQEALANCMKHARASRVDVRLRFCDDRVEIRVTDDGRGFALPDSLTSLARAGQMGLVGMFERAELLGGTVFIRSEPSRGTTVSASIPFQLGATSSSPG